ncbi:MAG: DUF2484 family protein [Pseudomonadota bacterium]
MSLSLGLAIAWALAATITALLPMRYQYPPGLALLVAAPVLIVFMGVQHGVFIAVLGLAAFLSMFRNPLRYFWRRWREKRTGVTK